MEHLWEVAKEMCKKGQYPLLIRGIGKHTTTTILIMMINFLKNKDNEE